MSKINRRFFLKASGLSIVPALAPFSTIKASNNESSNPPGSPLIKFFGDGEMFEPVEYLKVLQQANDNKPIVRDRYGMGGVVEELERKFAEITGKEKAIFMPSGTMANQFALAVLSNDKTKIFVQDTSHVNRDEADAAHSVFGKRLMPLAKAETYFTAEQLKSAIDQLENEEVFKSGIGAVSIENPVRRTDGASVPLEEIKKIHVYCKSQGIPMHLDGARLFMAAAWSGNTIKSYAQYFDTVYLSLYKYLGASAGAILCGSKEIIDKMPHLMKIHGGAMYGNWTNAAMALHRLDGFEDRLKKSIERSSEIFAALNKIPELKISQVKNGTNIYNLYLPSKTNGNKLQETLRSTFNIRIPRPNEKNHAQIMVNETLLYQPASYIIDAFKKALG